MIALLIGAVVTIVAAFGGAWLGAALQRKWTPNPIPVIDELGRNLAQRITELQEQTEAIEQERIGAEHFTLGMQLQQGSVGNYILHVHNDTDTDVIIETVQFFRGDAPLSDRNKPKSTDDWRIPAKSGKHLCWSPQPDPVSTLKYCGEPNLQGFAVPFRIVLVCQSRGKPRRAQRTILLTVDYRNNSLTQFGP